MGEPESIMLNEESQIQKTTYTRIWFHLKNILEKANYGKNKELRV